jgi:hypothetical protein
MDIITSGNIDRHNPVFYQKVISRLRQYPYYKIKRSELAVLDNLVLSHFGLKDKFQLRDKFEGEAYYKNASCVYTSVLFVRHLLGLNSSDLQVSIDLLSNPIISFQEKHFRVVNFSFGQMPKFIFDIKWMLDGVIFSMHRDEFSAYLCGFIDSKELYMLYSNVNFDLRSTKTNVKEFVNFEILKNVTDLKICK